jgi:hypothetical protein
MESDTELGTELGMVSGMESDTGLVRGDGDGGDDGGGGVACSSLPMRGRKRCRRGLLHASAEATWLHLHRRPHHPSLAN